MKRLNSVWILLSLIFGIVGKSAATSPIRHQASQNYHTPVRTSFQLAQTELGIVGECRAIKQETQIYANNNIRALTGIYLNQNDIIYLAENNRNDRRLIAVADIQGAFIGYVETSNLKFCPPLITQQQVLNQQQRLYQQVFNPQQQVFNPQQQVFNPQQQVFNPQQQVFNPQQQVFNPSFGRSLSRCEIIRETNLYDSPGFNSSRRKFLEIGENVEIDSQRIATANNFQWIYVSSLPNNSGWVIVDSVGCR